MQVKESTTDIVIKRLATTLKGLKCFVCQNGRGFQVVLPWTSQGRFEWRLTSRSRNLQTTPSWKKLSAHWGDIGKWERGQSKNQHNNFSKISTKSGRETKCVNTKWEAQMAESTEDKSGWQEGSTMWGYNRKQTLAPVLTGAGATTELFSPRGLHWRPQTETTCCWGRGWEEWLATAHHLLKVTLKKRSLPIV